MRGFRKGASISLLLVAGRNSLLCTVRGCISCTVEHVKKQSKSGHVEEDWYKYVFHPKPQLPGTLCASPLRCDLGMLWWM